MRSGGRRRRWVRPTQRRGRTERRDEGHGGAGETGGACCSGERGTAGLLRPVSVSKENERRPRRGHAPAITSNRTRGRLRRARRGPPRPCASTEMWPSPGCSHRSAPGIARGEPLTVRGRHDPVGARRARRGSAPPTVAGLEAPVGDVGEVVVDEGGRTGRQARARRRSRASPTARRRPPRRPARTRSRSRPRPWPAAASCASLASRPAAAARSDASPPGAMPANQPSPDAPNGATAETLTTARTRSPSSAPGASACVPPPE